MSIRGVNILLMLSIVISICFTNSDSSPTPGQGNIPANVARKIRRDAARLALRIEGEKEDLRYQSVGIPKDRLNGIYNILSNIYNLDEVGKSIEKCNSTHFVREFYSTDIYPKRKYFSMFFYNFTVIFNKIFSV